MRELIVAVVQMQPTLGQAEENMVKMGEFIRRVASEQPVDLIVFPELATTGYEAGPRFPPLAQRVPGHAVNIIAQRQVTSASTSPSVWRRRRRWRAFCTIRPS